jgi:hypothetical protein
VRPHPDADAASDLPSPHPLAKPLGEYHDQSLHAEGDGAMRNWNWLFERQPVRD